MGGISNGAQDGLHREARLIFHAMILLLLVAFVGIMIDPVEDKRGFTTFLFVRQDALLAIGIALMARFALVTGARAPDWLIAMAPRWWLVPLALLLVCWGGHHLVFQAHPLIRDEQMALFDAFIYRHGQIGWPIAPFWRDYAMALNQQFILPVAGHQAWLSDYLPGHAVTRVLVATMIDPAWTNPLLTAIGAVALWRIACRLWPDDAGARMTALLLYGGSSQVIIMGMTSYAMSGYLALNLVWLALFLRGGRMGHAGAMLTGVIATGWHQPIFHPLFVLPFFAMLGWQRRRMVLTAYMLAYGVIGLGWLAWPHLVADSMGGTPAQIDTVGYGGRILLLLSDFGPVNLWLMAMNLLRFVTWQHLLMMPLMLAGLWSARRDPLALALAAGLVIPIGAVTILLAYQGHGWGYRYLHGVIGNACLLGGYGWIALQRRGALPRFSTALHLASLLLVLPVHAMMAATIAAPYAAVSRSIAAIDADVAVIDDLAVAFGGDLVINRPDLSNRPIRLMTSQMDVQAMTRLCLRNRVAFVGQAQLAPVQRAIVVEESSTAHFARLRSACRAVSPARRASSVRTRSGSSRYS